MNNRRWLVPVVSILLLLSLVFAGGCEIISNTETTTSAVQTQITTTGTSATTGLTLSVASGESLESIVDVVARVKPSVVAINVKSIVTGYDIFGRPYSQEQEGAGSGWIISSDGFIVTNHHVVAGASGIMVTFNDGSSLPVDISTVKTDLFSDLAIMKVEAAGLPAVTIGDADTLKEGEWVVAIGNSLGEGIRVTQGIVSRKGASITDENGLRITGLIETDAVINPGNSGGPLVNMAGEVIGITNAKTVATGVEGVGYAISINTAVPIIQELFDKGYIVRPYLGTGTETMNSSYAFWYRLQAVAGALVTTVDADSPAAQAGLQVKDIIVRFNGQNITSSSELIDAIQKAEIGQEVEIGYWRGSDQFTVKVTIAETPSPQ